MLLQVGQVLVAIGSYFCGPAAPACAAAGSYEVARANGASGSQALRAGVIAGLTTWAFSEIGQAGKAGNWGTTAYVLSHAAVGCVSSAAGGGDCGAGALSAGFSKFATLQGPSFGIYGDFVKSLVVGGVASELGGGKFANGAVTAAFGYLFNACGNGRCFEFNAKNAEAYYREGSGKPLTVDLSEILDVITDPQVTWIQDPKNPDRYTLKTLGVDGLGPTSRSRVLGDITAIQQPDATFALGNDLYNFNQQPNPQDRFSIWRRNVLTKGLERSVGPGRQFDIIFTGTFRR